jgi:hypothetical protein
MCVKVICVRKSSSVFYHLEFDEAMRPKGTEVERKEQLGLSCKISEVQAEAT